MSSQQYVRKVPSVEVRQNVWGNWNGYIGGKRVHEIGSSEFDAKIWLKETVEIKLAQAIN